MTSPARGRRNALLMLGSGLLASAIDREPASAQGQQGAQQTPKRIFVTGSSEGIGLAAARRLIEMGHHVVLHGRNRKRADDAMAAAPGCETAVIGDVSVIAETRSLAAQVNRIGRCDAVIHNVGIGGRAAAEKTADGLPPIFAVNTLAPYILTALIERPKRLVYVSSSVHRGVTLDPGDLTYASRQWNGWDAYAESKLQDVLLAFAVARRWPNVFSNAMDPGWVPTQMGGAGAPGSVAEGAETEVWLAVSDDAAAQLSGRFFYHRREQPPNPAARNLELQDKLLAACERISGVALPA
ncbi:MAG: SDR family NAD(P)-dependent oxidoreductase [Acetobacteraceae bacterium]|nr:SDR family NAD(P)-dependent oxidoreductase [Acetobacteraceae bacterium]